MWNLRALTGSNSSSDGESDGDLDSTAFLVAFWLSIFCTFAITRQCYKYSERIAERNTKLRANTESVWRSNADSECESVEGTKYITVQRSQRVSELVSIPDTEQEPIPDA